ncbi:MAG: hypothetical protein JXR46_16300 [Calditrichaceae bacterium]|nr:hypothetical protein [Calditrichaceae bacterium]MBN2710607.1 hypothetical protein [Calditrichaceae bacterium]RQV96787.1 MAG: hypothetical protein EH224_03425 [Calditrichota bacterium]
MIKRVNYLYICLLMFSNLFSQEVFFEKDQTGLNLGYLYSSAGKSLDKTDEAISNSIVGSYVFKGSFFFYGRVSDFSEEVNFHWKETINGFGYGIGVGVIINNKNDPLPSPFSLLISLSYSSTKYKSKYESNINTGGASVSISIFKNIKLTKNLNLIPEIFGGYGIGSFKSKNESAVDNILEYGLGINIGYLKEKNFGPSISVAIAGSEEIAIFSLGLSVSFKNLHSSP